MMTDIILVMKYYEVVPKERKKELLCWHSLTSKTGAQLVHENDYLKYLEN